jgi:hypothetical protein
MRRSGSIDEDAIKRVIADLAASLYDAFIVPRSEK